jgi:choline dehydrogenase
MVANAMNFMMPPDSLWEYITDLTDDSTWSPDKMRGYFEELERVVYLENDPNHGYDGYITVSSYSLPKAIHVD